jgi:hypothetical protein
MGNRGAAMSVADRPCVWPTFGIALPGIANDGDVSYPISDTWRRQILHGASYVYSLTWRRTPVWKQTGSIDRCSFRTMIGTDGLAF